MFIRLVEVFHRRLRRCLFLRNSNDMINRVVETISALDEFSYRCWLYVTTNVSANQIEARFELSTNLKALSHDFMPLFRQFGKNEVIWGQILVSNIFKVPTCWVDFCPIFLYTWHNFRHFKQELYLKKNEMYQCKNVSICILSFFFVLNRNDLYLIWTDFLFCNNLSNF